MTAVSLEAAVRSTVLIMLVWAAIAALRLRNPHRQKALWTSVVFASLCMPLLMQIHLAPAVAAPVLRWTIGPGGAALTDASGVRLAGVLVYLIPTLLLVCRYAFGFHRARRIRREAQSLCMPWANGLDVRVSGRVASPATFGTTILLPLECSTWSRRKLEAVMAHERAHVLHRDCYVLWLARLHACVFWFNPLAWWLARKLAALAEQTSDEAAVETVGDPVDYAEILLGLRMRPASELAAAMASSDLPARIERILSGVTRSPALRLPQLLAMVAAVLPAVALAAAPLRPIAVAGASETASLQPRVVSWGPLASYYPREAMHKGIEGMVELAVTLDSAGRATDTQILTEYPLDMGFGAAASALAHVMKYSNPTEQPVTFTIHVKFALTEASPARTDSSQATVGG